MFNFLKNKETLLRNKVQKLVLKSNFQQESSNRKIASIAVLTTNEISKEFNLNELIEKYFPTRKIKIYSFRKFDKKDKPSKDFFSEKDITKKGKIMNKEFNNFLEEEFDLLICFFDVENVFLEYAAAISKSNYKVGFASVNSNLLDIEIVSKTKNAEEFFTELKKYLVILNKLVLEENLTVKAIL